MEARSWARAVHRREWHTRIPGATGGITSRLPHPSTPTLPGRSRPHAGEPVHTPTPPSLPTPGSPPPPVRRPDRPSAHALGSRARPAPSLLLSTHSTTGEGAGEEGAGSAT